ITGRWVSAPLRRSIIPPGRLLPDSVTARSRIAPQMSAPVLPSVASSAADADGASPLRPGEAHALLRVGFERFKHKLMELTHAALEVTDDLFESASPIPDGEVEAFRQQRAEWFARFGSALSELFERRLSGHRRKGLRPDADASLAALRVLTPFDHEKQAALTQAARYLVRLRRRDLAD